MKKLSLLFALFFLASLAQAGMPVKYSQIKIFVPDAAALGNIWSTGIDYEGVSGRVGGWMEFIAGSEELRRLSRGGISYSIVVDDLTKENQKHLSRTPQNALGFGYGSMGGFYTYDEMLRQLDSMKLQYPTLITARESLGATEEGRALWMAKISSNPDVADPAKPEVLYTAIHHAREPEGMMAAIYYMWWLLQNYGTDAEATYLVNTRQMYFIPIVNPDGYAFNQAIAPGGGGLWRKNRRNNGGGSYGVDLNRNYGNYAFWDSPYGGSSADSSNDTYRGAAPFSEPETQAISRFLINHNIKTCINYHTYGNYIIYPYNSYPRESDDSLIFREFAFDMSGYNRYLSGIATQAVGYIARGGADDYMYGAGGKPMTFSLTHEVGPSFWAPTDLILPLAVQNLGSNKYMSYVAGQYTVAKGCKVIDQNLNGGIERGEHFSVTVTFANKGLGDAENIHASVAATNTEIHWTVSEDSIWLIAPRSSAELTFSGIRSSSSVSSANTFIITITDEYGYLHRDTIVSPLGTPLTLFADSASAGTTNWNTGTGWGTTATAHTPPYSFTDSPDAFYYYGNNNALTLLHSIKLPEASHPFLNFWTKWAIVPRNDFCLIEISSDSGTTWTSLRSELSHPGSGFGVQTPGTWGYDGYNPSSDWIEQHFDLSSYAGSNVLVRFHLMVDGWDIRDGIYVDDISIVAYKDTTSFATYDLPVEQRWNLFSLPVRMDAGTKAAVFPNATAGAYSYAGVSGYVIKDTVQPGKGYWVQFNSAQTLSIPGFLQTSASIDVTAGWNLIGSISVPVPVNTIGSDPPGLVLSSVFQYNNGIYAITDTILPGEGHWVKVDRPGSLILSAAQDVSYGNRARVIATSELPPPAPDGSGIASEKPAMMPKEFRLEQNYPNPFNPTTTINYAVAEAAHVSLKVYNTLGQEVVTLIDGVQGTGYKSVEFETNNLPSGIYFYRLTAGAFTDVKKMVIIR
jgi:carboxypeptidase T